MTQSLQKLHIRSSTKTSLTQDFSHWVAVKYIVQPLWYTPKFQFQSNFKLHNSVQVPPGTTRARSSCHYITTQVLHLKASQKARKLSNRLSCNIAQECLMPPNKPRHSLCLSSLFWKQTLPVFSTLLLQKFLCEHRPAVRVKVAGEKRAQKRG